MKKEYIVPTFEIFELCPENMIAKSVGQGGEDDVYDPKQDIELSNKREPNAPWGKSPWE